MKFLLIPYIACGFVSAKIFGIYYSFIGDRYMPMYWGCPFVFKKQSFDSSLESFYSISGIALNVAIWSILLFLIDKGIRRLTKTKGLRRTYRVFIGLLVFFSTINVLFDSLSVSQGFQENRNYWYWDIDKVAEEAGGRYEGKPMKLY